MKLKTCQKPILFALCLLLMTSLLTFSVAAEVDPLDYLLRDEFGLETPLDVSLLESLDELASSGMEGILTDVRELADAECYEIVIRTGIEETVHGAIYYMNDTYYYLNYVKLGNQHFDADGYFSYRSGEVVLTNAETYRAEIEEELIPILNPFYEYGDYEYPIYDENGKQIGVGGVGSASGQLEAALFWIGCILLGIVAPIPFFVAGLVLSRSKKLGYPRYWRILSLIAGIWMVSAIVLMILLAIA